MNADKIKDYVTTDNVILKSVNEVGHFLYFAGTNSWMILKDKDGKTIHEYSTVEWYKIRNDGYDIYSEPRRTSDGYYESCVSDSDGNRIEIVAQIYREVLLWEKN